MSKRPSVDELNADANSHAAAKLGGTPPEGAPSISDAPSPSKTRRGKNADGVTRDLRTMGLENFEAVRIHRSKLTGAKYNPRILGDAERRKLKAGIERHGLVSPVTWNERTGNIVAGHQRIEQLDALAGTDDYDITVAKIDVDEGREKELNILLNNASAQGDWDMQLLSDLIKDPALKLEGTGFDHADLYQLFGDSPLLDRNEKLDELADKVRDARDRYDAIEADNGQANSQDFYCVLVFRDGAQCTKFLKAAKLPDNRYQSGEQIASAMGLLEQIAAET